MLFIKSDNLKEGMRLARPIYNRNGVLLYERDSKLSSQGIMSVRNFGLIGLYILEPAEPVPPMTQEDLAFERFQTIEVFAIKEELTSIVKNQRKIKLPMIVADVVRNYGRLDHKINFIQNLRSNEDRLIKHALNVAILSALISHNMGLPLKTQTDIVTGAILHVLGEFENGFSMIETVTGDEPNIKRMCMQAKKATEDWEKKEQSEIKMDIRSKILFVAEIFDKMTAMQLDVEPKSVIYTVKMLAKERDFFDSDVVIALISSINLLTPGVCVEFTSGEKGVVIVENKTNVFRPIVLGFQNNKVFDLSNHLIQSEYEIMDVMKTMDNRVIIDEETIKAYIKKDK